MIILQVNLPRRTLLVYACIWHWFDRKIRRILVVFNYQLLWLSWGSLYLWHLMCWFRNMPSFYFFRLVRVDNFSYFQKRFHCWSLQNKIFIKSYQIMRGRFKNTPTYILGPITAVLCPTCISKYKFCNAIFIYNMSCINLTAMVRNLALRRKQIQGKMKWYQDTSAELHSWLLILCHGTIRNGQFFFIWYFSTTNHHSGVNKTSQ